MVIDKENSTTVTPIETQSAPINSKLSSSNRLPNQIIFFFSFYRIVKAFVSGQVTFYLCIKLHLICFMLNACTFYLSCLLIFSTLFLIMIVPLLFIF